MPRNHVFQLRVFSLSIALLGVTSCHHTYDPYEYESEPSLNEYGQFNNLCYELDLAQMSLRSQPTTNNYNDFVIKLAALDDAIEKSRLRIADAEAYSNRHPDNHLFLNQIDEARNEFQSHQQKYDAYVAFYAPFKADYEVEKRRTASKRTTYKELIAHYIEAQHIPSSQVVVSDAAIYFVEDAVVKDGVLTIISHLSVVPECNVTFDEAHAQFSGQSLGSVETSIDPDSLIGRLFTWTLGDGTHEIKHVINVADAGLPDKGVIKLAVSFSGVLEPSKEPRFPCSATLTIPYSGTLTREVKMGDTITLHGRKEGNHLFLKAMIMCAGQEIPRECLVDTGASLTAASNLPLNANGTETTEFETANGMLSMPVINATVSVGPITKDIKVAVSKDDAVNLLGANFFEGFLFTIDLENSAIILIKR